MEQEFEEYWKKHSASLILAAPKALRDERKNSGKMNTAGDWLLFIVPIFIMVVFQDSGLIHNEMLNFIVSVAIGVVAFGVSMLLKPYVTGKRSITDIDADIKSYFFLLYQEKGLDYLEQLLK